MAPIIPITIFVRHSGKCSYTGETTDRKVRCKCRKHLRYVDPETGKQVRIATKARDWAGADRVLEETKEKLRKHGAPEETTDITLEEAAKQFVQAKDGQNISCDVVNQNRLDLDRLRTFCEGLGITKLRQVTLPVLTAYRATWATASTYKSAQTRAKTQGRIRSFFLYAVRAGWLLHSPAQGLTRIAHEHRQTMPLTPEEYKTVLETIPKIFDGPEAQFMRAHVQLMRHSGLAVEDATLLRRDRLQQHPQKRIWRIITKRTKQRKHNPQVVYVPIPTSVALELKELPSPHQDYFFFDGGSELSAVYYTGRYYKRLFEAAGVTGDERMTSHRLRDTFAVEMLKAGISLTDVSKMLGHSSVTTTEKHYAAWVKERQDRLDELVTATFAD